MNILSLFDWTGTMARPWLEAGHSATLVDIERHGGERWGAKCVQGDVAYYHPDERYDVVFAFPPCTHLANSGARWWADKGDSALGEALALLAHTRRVIAESGARVWMIENPSGRLSTHWRPPDYRFDPCDYGGYLNPPGDAYTKRTCLWTSKTFRMPPPRRVEPVEGSKMHRVGPSKVRARIRSATPEGFARAVFFANTSCLTTGAAL